MPSRLPPLLSRCALCGSVLLLALLAACAASVGTTTAPEMGLPQRVASPKPRPTVTTQPAVARPALAPLAEVDGPGAAPAPDPASVPDAEPVLEPIRLGGPNKPYEALGRSYVPITEDRPFIQRGLASWYGRKFHGRRTASGEAYDMYAMSAAHPTLPLPSFVRVRNPVNGNQVVLRINDRGPFHPGRIIDLSYTAAQKLGVLQNVATVEVERITREEIRTGSWRRGQPALDPADMSVDRQLAKRNGSPSSVSTATKAAPAEPQAVAVAVMKSPGPPTATEPPAADVMLVATPAYSTGAVMPVSFIARSSPVAVGLPLDAAAGIPLATSPARAPAFWVQLGAFRLRDGAEVFQRRVTTDLAWLAPVLMLQSEAELHRLQAGPYSSRDEAHGVAQRVREALSLVPVVVER